jgi:nucleoside-diphosphate-sugar epimerase
MRVFVTGATGFVGSAIVQSLLRGGHQVTGLARSDANAGLLTAAGAQVFRGSLGDLEGLARAAAAAEGVIHTAHNHDFLNVSREVAAKEDLLAIEAMGAALEGTGRPLVISAGVSAPSEELAGDPGHARSTSEQVALAMASRGVRAMVVRLPPSVHGDGDHGLVPMLIGIAHAKGVSGYIGDGLHHWPATHRFDAAEVYRLALEQGAAGARYHAVAEERVPTRAIAEAIGRGLKLPAVSVSKADAPNHFGFLASFFGRDVPASSAQTRERLGWRPGQVGLIQDLDRGTYFQAASVTSPR